MLDEKLQVAQSDLHKDKCSVLINGRHSEGTILVCVSGNSVHEFCMLFLEMTLKAFLSVTACIYW